MGFISKSQVNASKNKKHKKNAPWNEYKLHVVILFLAIIAQLIGIQRIYITNTVSVVIMPLLYAMILGLLLYLAKPIKFIGSHESKVAESLMILFIAPLLAKLAVSSGQALDLLIRVGPAIILQELGNLGTIFFALPIALLLGFKRETIGMTSSICREPNIGVIVDKFGFKSPETRGVLTVFVIGTIIGTVFISLLASLTMSLPLHPYALAMASGVGSASMNAAAIAPLIATFPGLSGTIEAFAGFSNLISFCFGLYLTIFVGLPLTEKLYCFLEPKIGRTTSASLSESAYVDEKMKKVDLNKETKILNLEGVRDWIILLIIFSVIVVISNYVGYGRGVFNSFIGMLILSSIALMGILCEKLLPHHISSIVYVSLIGLILACPWSPTSDIIVNYVSNVELLSIVTVFLAYVGIAIGRDWGQFKKLGWRGVIVAVFVITGTYLGSACIAQLVLLFTAAI